MRTMHPQVHIEHGEQAADVDEKLAPLILEMWRAGFYTVRSCQRHMSGMVWVEMVPVEAVEAFLDIAAPYDSRSGSLWRRASGWGFGMIGLASEPIRNAGVKGAWEYHVTVSDDSFDEASGTRIAPVSDFRLSVSVLFPRRDLPAVLERMRDHNAAR